MARSNAQVARQQFFDAGGRPLGGGQLYIFDSGSEIAAPAWKDYDEAGDNQHTHPIILDSAGFTPGPIVLETGRPYRFRMEDRAGVLQWLEDHVQGVGSNDTDLSVVDRIQIRSTASSALQVAGGIQAGTRQIVTAAGFVGVNGVPTDALQDRAVTGAKVALGTLTAEHLAAGAIPNALTPGSVMSEHYADGSIPERAYAPTTIPSAALKPRIVTSAILGIQACETVNLKDGHVTRVKLAPDALPNIAIVNAGQAFGGPANTWAPMGAGVTITKRRANSLVILLFSVKVEDPAGVRLGGWDLRILRGTDVIKTLGNYLFTTTEQESREGSYIYVDMASGDAGATTYKLEARSNITTANRSADVRALLAMEV